MFIFFNLTKILQKFWVAFSGNGVSRKIAFETFSEQLQTADQSSKPDFEADFYLGSKLGKFWDFIPRISNQKAAIFWFTLIGPLCSSLMLGNNVILKLESN